MRLSLIAAALLLTAGSAFGYVPPTDEQVASLVSKITAIKFPADNAGRQAAAKQRADLLSEGLASMSLAEATVPQIEKLAESGVLAGNGVALSTLAPHLAELAKSPTVEGARAAELRLPLLPPLAPGATPAERTKAAQARATVFTTVYTEALAHPGMPDLIKAGKGEQVFLAIAGLSPEVTKSNNILPAVEKLLVPEMSLESAAALSYVVLKVSDPDTGLDKAERVRWLDKIAAVSQGAIDRAGAVPPEKETAVKRARETVMRAKSAYARGELIGGPAPELGFTWSSDGKLKDIAELKGNVVVLNFWTTWLWSCVKPNPKIHRLVDRYESAGSPVRVIGVTSLQGTHAKRNVDDPEKEESRIDCRNDPTKEYGLMTEFMNEMKMNWTVGFSPDGFVNPNFGVVGIPHLVIIDSTGKVRYNALHPHNIEDVAAKIDALLKEAGLKVPTEPMVDPEKDKKGNPGK